MEPLEEKERSGRSILNREDIKCIFGNVPEILSVHQSLLVGYKYSVYMSSCSEHRDIKLARATILNHVRMCSWLVHSAQFDHDHGHAWTMLT